jgi:streptogramin lyase
MTMRAAWRLLLVCLMCCLTGLAVSSPAAFAEGSPLGEGTGASSSLESSLVTPGSPTEGEQLQAQEEAKRSSPEAVAEREVSRTEFENLDTEQAAKVAAEEFPAVIDESAGGPPKLPSGQSITSYLSDNAASVDVGGGKQAVIESMAPMAVQTSSGERVPVDLGLRDVGSVLEPTTPAVGVQIPKQLGGGVQLPSVGVSLTPVDGSGSPLGGSEGVVDGQSVLYANTQTDMDSLVKPTTAGFEADTLLRSVDSPQQLFFRVGLPAGASLVQAKDGSGAVEVVEEGAVIATVLPPGANDAAGTVVPVSMSVSGNTLVVSVDDHAAEYQYPIAVDPEVKGEDSQLTANGSKRSNWEFYTSNGKKEPSANFASNSSCEHWGGGFLETCGVHEYKEGEAAFWVYQTRGVSKIYEFEGETEASNKEDRIESIVELQHEGGVTEEKELLSNEAKGPVEYSRKPLPEPLCPKGKESCVPTSGNKENAVHFQQSVVNKPTSKYSFSDAIDSGTVYISEPEKTHSTTSYNNSSPEFEIEVENSKKEKEKQKRKNALYGSSNWLSEYDGAIQFIAKDTGIGVSASRLEYENSGKWEVVSGSEHNYLEGGLCKGVQCESEQKEYWTLNKHLPNGEDKIRYRAEEAFGDATHETESLEAEGVGTVKVDYSKPHGIFVSGLPYGNELSEKTYELTTYATDGEGSTVASSGIMGIEGKEKGIALYVDGHETKEVGTQTGCSASHGKCTASAKWTINGSELGAGHHAIVVVVKDRAGNEGRGEETIAIRHSTPVPLGPGSVDLESGDFTLGASDVSLGSGLSVSRVYSSRDLTAGGEGSLLGLQWSLSVGSEETLVEMVDHSVLVTSATGGQTIFAAILNSKQEPTGKFEAPPGDSNLTMTLEENEKKEKLAYYLKDPAVGTSTKFSPSSTSKVWVPIAQEGPVPTDTVSYLYETVEVAGKKVTRPMEELAAHPKVSCSPKMEPGCRALKFTYATKTKSEIGEGPSEWGEYEGRLVKVSYEGYNPATKKMTETPIPVAEYSYDKQGRLRAEWDPRISPALKTTYGYDAEGHVTALNPPGQEAWVFTYGTSAGDGSAGRLVKVTRAPASAGLWNGKTVVATKAPALSGSALVGIRMAVSNGTWSNSPVAYGYQWEDCLSQCTPIPGATNANYTPTVSDTGYRLEALVTATNGGGSSTYTVSSEIVEWARTTSYSTPGHVKPIALTAGPEKDLWYIEPFVNGIKSPTIAKMTTSGEATEYTLPTEERPSDITSGPDGNLWFTESSNSEIGKMTPTGESTIYKLRYLNLDPGAITTGSDGDLWFVGGNKISKSTTAGKVTEYQLPPSSTPLGIAAGSDKNLWFTEDGTSKIGKITTSGTITEYELPSGSDPYSITSGPANMLWFTDTGTGKIGKISTSGTITEYPRLTQKYRLDDIVASEGYLWFNEQESEKISRLNPSTTEGEAVTPGPGTTIDYNVPVSGTGAPYNMSASEVAKWGQKGEGAPEEATAIFPPDSPQGWPASSYTRATVYYLDEKGRLVNTATPSTGTYGSISTMEYNETNDVVRTLSPDNRATALEAGTKSEEVASLLSTFNTYKNKCSKESEFNEERESTEPGTRLCETEGPAHAVKYVAGKEQKEAPYARHHVKYFYNEKVPAEGPNKESFANQAFDLMTESKSLTEIVNSKGAVQEEVEPRTTVTSYSGQSNLGWKLRSPTSITVEPEGAKVTDTTLYNENGQVAETRGPKGSEGNSAHDSKIVYYSSEENKEYTVCGKHPEWAGLVCETLPAKQPETTGLPKLPVTTTTYNMWDEPEKIEETIGEKTRTTKDEYDAAGRMKSSEETSTATTESTDKALPKVTEEYNSTTGALEKQSTIVGEKTKTMACSKK